MKAHTWVRAFTLIEMLVVIAIIATLAALLLPSLGASREHARRTACRGNLHELGIGLESYCGDYGQYYPSWAAWGVQPYEKYDMLLSPIGIMDHGVTRDSNGQTVHTAGGGVGGGGQFLKFNNQNQVILYRTVFAGENVSGHEAQRGYLQKAPVGLGNLVTSGYAPDAQSLYCPSSAGMPAPEMEGGRPEAATQLRDLRAVGGTRRDAVLYGDYSRIGRWNGQINFGRTVLSHYHYRLQPTAVQPSSLWREFYPHLRRIRVLYTKPDRVISVGEPVFKTQKQLGRRAIVTDSWSKSVHEDSSHGDGGYGHREGYNALYGDGAVSWVADPGQRIAWWMPDCTSLNHAGPRAYDSGIAANVVCDYVSVTPGYVPTRSAPRLATAIWHLFDLNEGIDVDADELAWENGI